MARSGLGGQEEICEQGSACSELHISGEADAEGGW